MKNAAGYIKKIFCLMIFLTMLFASSKAYASSADIILSVDTSEIHRGDYFTVTIEIDAEVLPGDFEGYLIYPAQTVKYISGPGLVSGENGVLKIEDHVTLSERNSRKYALIFRAMDSGEALIVLKDNPELYEFEEGYLMSVSCNELVLKIEADSTPTPTEKQEEDTDKATPTEIEPDIKDGTEDITSEVTPEITHEQGEPETDITEVPSVTQQIKEDPEKNNDAQVTKEPEKTVRSESAEALELAASYEKSLSMLTLIIAVLSALCMALLIIVIRLSVKRKKDDHDE